jgi:tetratricopeptide (TPR) repeat protein
VNRDAAIPLQTLGQRIELYNRAGAMALKSGQRARALEFLRASLQLLPAQPPIHLAVAALLLEDNNPASALAHLERALRWQPDFPEALYNRGNALLALGQPATALASFERAIELKPDFAAALNNRGKALQQLQRFEEALKCFDKALLFETTSAFTQLNRADTLVVLRRPEEALQSYRQVTALAAAAPAGLTGAIMQQVARGLLHLHAPEAALEATLAGQRLEPNNPALATEAGHALVQLERTAEALLAFQRALLLAPQSSDALCNIGGARFKLGDATQARVAYQEALQLKPERLDALNGLTMACLQLRDAVAAASANERALRLAPRSAEAHTHSGNLHLLMGNTAAAERSFRRALELQSDFHSAAMGLAFLQLSRGEYREGWGSYEVRFALGLPGLSPRAYLQPRWDGTAALQGHSILLWSEQGLGDTLQFSRYALELRTQGATVILEVDPNLTGLIRSLHPEIRVIGAGENPGTFDYHCPLLSAPLGCRTDAGTIPVHVPYLKAAPERIERWAAQLGAPSEGLRIGLCWAGNAQAERYLASGRSLTLEALAPLLELRATRWFALQKGPAAAQLESLPTATLLHRFDSSFDEGSQAFMDSAAVMMHLDLVITTDTAVAHLAGALGVPVWVLLHATPEWRWLRERSDSPWYPSMTLFRQAIGDSPARLIETVRAALQDLVGKRLVLRDLRTKSRPGEER